jgi:hypothetical protein
MTTTYTSDGFRPIKQGHEHIERDRHGEISTYREVESARDAAWVFANRLAKRTFGSRGYCHHVRMDGASTDGRYANYEAFIGVPAQGGGTNGRNVWLSVYVEPSAEPGKLSEWK